jgi:dihydrofolate synthase/folylpolyglutamate synthase
MTTDNALATLHALPRYAGVADDAYKPGLERMEALMDAMDRPHEAFPSVHVAGTNGKGSTASMIAAIATADGQRTGLHTSPHLLHVTERMRVDGVPAPAEWLAEAVARYRSAFERIAPSFFEATVALSFRYFAEQRVDRAIAEVGLGGRLDATNVLDPVLAIITNVDRDHTNILGDTLAAIAREKAGIIKRRVPVLTGGTHPEALAVIREVAAERAAPLHETAREVAVHRAETTLEGVTIDVETPVRTYDGLQIGLHGAYQRQNAVLAVRAAELLALDAGAIREGLRDVRGLAGLRGRFDVLRTDPLVVADAAHNPSGLAAALDAVRTLTGRQPEGTLHVAFGGVQDKDVVAMARLLAQAGATVIPLRFDAPRAMPAGQVAAVLEAEGATVAEPAAVDAVQAHFERHAGPHDVLLITGSHGVVVPLLPENAA